MRENLDTLNALNYVRNGYGRIVENRQGILKVCGVSDRPWIYLAAPSGREVEAIALLLPGEENLAAVSDELYRLRPGKWRMRAGKYFYRGNTDLEADELDMLTADDTGWILEQSDYGDFLTGEYVEDRIKKGVTACIRIQNSLVAWALTHDDGALGFLHVLPRWRRRGLGERVLRCAVKRILARGDIPFAHIEDHKDSVRLALRNGFEFHSYVNWTGN